MAELECIAKLEEVDEFLQGILKKYKRKCEKIEENRRVVAQQSYVSNRTRQKVIEAEAAKRRAAISNDEDEQDEPVLHVEAVEKQYSSSKSEQDTTYHKASHTPSPKYTAAINTDSQHKKAQDSSKQKDSQKKKGFFGWVWEKIRDQLF